MTRPLGLRFHVERFLGLCFASVAFGVTFQGLWAGTGGVGSRAIQIFTVGFSLLLASLFLSLERVEK